MHDGGGEVRAAPKVAEGWTTDGVHLLRTAYQVQYQLSQMADTKANMLLGITFLIFTISVGQARAGQENLPLLILGGAAFIAATLAVTAVLPSLAAIPPPKGASGLIFFGAFAQMDEEEYVQMLLAHSADPIAIYEAFARDIYSHGKVLASRKYRLLGWAYRVLLTGLISSLVAFVISYAPKLLPH
jgi:hypothetical protein